LKTKTRIHKYVQDTISKTISKTLIQVKICLLYASFVNIK